MGFFSGLFKRLSKPKKKYKTISSPLRDAIKRKDQEATRGYASFIYGLMVPLANFDFPDLPHSTLARTDIRNPLNSDEALLYVGHFYFAWAYHYAETEECYEAVKKSIVSAHIEFCRLYARIYSTAVPAEEAKMTFYLVVSRLEHANYPKEGILTEILLEKVLHFAPNGSVSLEQLNISNDIDTCVGIWTAAYEMVLMYMIDDLQRAIEREKAKAKGRLS